ncbi:hypothetical protein RN001_006703 [Aquatica leii]|uniref:Mediator of RNA polymerase II transcription subunit 19 n=1 Tax=Aquatica leii TaxID=1421715 RepID=A0AAN7Q213_9COLE|nr:hypothetical protein RN001_006703 [Aquatica leii]
MYIFVTDIDKAITSSFIVLTLTSNGISSPDTIQRELLTLIAVDAHCMVYPVRQHLSAGPQDNSSLRSVIEKPPIGGKELLPLTSSQLDGFRLHPGPLPEQYRYINQTPIKKQK